MNIEDFTKAELIKVLKMVYQFGEKELVNKLIDVRYQAKAEKILEAKRKSPHQKDREKLDRKYSRLELWYYKNIK